MNPPIPHFFLYQTAFGLQVAAVALFIGYAIFPRRGISLSASVSLSLAALLQSFFLADLGLAQGGLPLASGFGALCFWSLSLTAVALWAEWRHQLGLLGAFLAPLSALMLLMGFRFAQVDAQAAPGLPGLWLTLHVALAMFSYACFTAAAGTAAAFLVEESQLKRKHLSSLLYKLPPLAVLEDLAANFAWAGSAALGASLAVGFVWKKSLALAPGLDDPKVLFAIVVWLAYAGSSVLRLRSSLRGRRYAYLLLALFLSIFFGYYLLNIYFGGHGFLKPVAGA
jgi:ABC-type uncharacterized transport system permease subunit